MGNRIMVVCGSPRKQGNTSRVVGWMAEAARAAGAEVEIVHAVDLEFKAPGCTACMGCQKSEEFRCVIDDEVSEVVARMPEASAVVLATPIYFYGPTAQLKMVIDRCYSLLKFAEETVETLLAGTEIVLLATAGGPTGEGLKMLDDTMRSLAQALALPYDSLLVASAPADPEEIESNTKLKERAAALGRRLAGA